MSKKVIALVAIVALIAIVAVCLTACNADSIAKKLDKKGYEAVAMSADDISEEYGEDASIKWAVEAFKGRRGVQARKRRQRLRHQVRQDRRREGF